MQDASTTITSTKQNNLQEKNQTAIVTKSTVQNNIASISPVCINSGSFKSGLVDNSKVLRVLQNKSRQLTNSGQTAVVSQTSDGVNVKSTTMENRLQNSNVVSSKSVSSVCGKVVNQMGQSIPIRSIRASNPNTSHVRPVAMVIPEMSKTPLRAPQSPELLHLSEQIKQTKMKHMLQKQKQLQSEQQKLQQNNVQRQLPNTLQHPIQISLKNPARGSITPNIAAQPKAQQVLPNSQGQQQMQKPSMATSVSPTVHNTHSATPMDIDTSECIQDKGHQMAEPSSPNNDNSRATESIAYLQKTIKDPANTIVQHQIKGNIAKMLVIATGEQRLITFDIPNEDCTVHDLLDQVKITFSDETSVSLVLDPALDINYIVDAGYGSCDPAPHDVSDCSSTPEVVSSTTDNENASQNTNASDENSNPSIAPNEIFYKKNNERNAMKVDRIERDGSTCKRPRGKGKGVALKPKPINKEPECLTISSDEEEEGKTRKIGINSNAVLGNACNTFDDDVDTILEKEPIITNTSVFNPSSRCDDEMSSEENRLCDHNHGIYGDNRPIPPTALQCRTVRIGSYKYIPREKIVISQSGVRFGVPLLEDGQNFVTLDVKYSEIVKVLIHFGKTMPVLFFYTSTSMGAMIRELLGMQDPKGPYYDPAGRDHTHKRITLLPDELTNDSKIKLKSIFLPRGKMEELSPKEANDILLRASPMDNQQVTSIVRRQSQGSLLNITNDNGSIQTITVYPPPPAKGGIAINTEDYLCLAEDQFLNDVIIDFYLKYLTLEVLSESDQHRTHVFSSYFYKRLTSPHAQAAENPAQMTPAAKRHARVQKWTKNVNIFEKDFIIIPINEHAHWFLAIICFPGLVGKVAPNSENDTRKTNTQKTKKMKEVKTKAVTIGCTTITPVPATITIDQPDDGSERDEAEGDDDEMEIDSDEEDETEQPEQNIQIKIKPGIVKLEETVKVPCILIFDSLAGASRARVVATLRDYLSCEHLAKLGVEQIFSKDTIKGACPKVPQQSNFTDCGLYVLQYVESFFQNPIQNYTLPIKALKMWFEEIVVTRKREELSDLLIKLVNATKGDRTINLPSVNFPTQDGKLKPKSENQIDVKVAKSELENKRKPTTDADSRISMSVVAESTESSNEVVNRTFQIIPYSQCISSNSTDSNPTELLTEPKTTRSSSETMSYLKSKRIPRLMLRTQTPDDSQAAKKHKGEPFNSCK
ncbi:PREDICTED: sentrin-specific protease 7-like isoform X2 [Dinoponera quadriceps]|nr:PREDICTED: sentrin-specific protease 7-like isoform X2 [Dinoponera quadriceps]XP_014473885.1 PREDICTED: sentrin-specific protease 7-like isoform X2 [Dinoponera quadriceps]